MKLGRDTASFTNYLMSGTKGQPEPEVGMGVTFLEWTDRHAGTITRVIKDAKGTSVIAFETQDDHAILVSGSCLSEAQEYRFERNPNGVTKWYRKDRNGLWRHSVLGESYRYRFIEKSQTIRLGERDEYRDPSF